MFQERDLVQVVTMQLRTHEQKTDYFFRAPLLGDIGTILDIATAGAQPSYFVECLNRRAVTIWIDQFTIVELAAVSVEAARKFTSSDGPDAYEVARRAYKYYQRSAVVAVAQGILSGQLSIIAGTRQLVRLRPVITSDVWDPDFLIFIGIDSETDALPVGAERQHWDPAVLPAKDLEIAHMEDFYREYASKGCRRLLARLSAIDDLL